jgi:antitoxin HicB
MFEYPIEIIAGNEEEGYTLQFPDMTCGITEGDTIEEALSNAVDCLDTVIDIYILHRKEALPPPSPANGRHVISPSPQYAMKAALHNEMLAQNVTKSELSRRIKMATSNVERLVSPRYKTKIETMAEAFSALGKRLEIRVV